MQHETLPFWKQDEREVSRLSANALTEDLAKTEYQLFMSFAVAAIIL